MLRIRLIGTNDPAEIFPAPLIQTVPENLKHLELENFGIAEILTFVPQDHRDLSKTQRVFLRRIQDVTVSMIDSVNRLDLYAQDLADCIIKECRLDDGGVHLYGRFSRLALRIGSEQYIMLSDREGRRRSGELVWILQHSKHRLECRYKQGDIQMVASLLAACQENFARNQGTLDVKVLYGIKVVGEEFFLYSVNFKEEYLQQIAEEPPNVDLVAHKYPDCCAIDSWCPAHCREATVQQQYC
ncbi:hypothetical protein GOP47_0014683 [Adiantum capillus-veneris]|uniref:Uncharacterized protein n=1 Tax=Adiantum capillus-veneris TaxID=13818 RepID=A0A9D4UM62_ADICA|nr:hypothetical protein GOP47_0014683 [Adiantum capillus-veneris]